MSDKEIFKKILHNTEEVKEVVVTKENDRLNKDITKKEKRKQ